MPNKIILTFEKVVDILSNSKHYLYEVIDGWFGDLKDLDKENGFNFATDESWYFRKGDSCEIDIDTGYMEVIKPKKVVYEFDKPKNCFKCKLRTGSIEHPFQCTALNESLPEEYIYKVLPDYDILESWPKCCPLKLAKE